MTVHCSFNHPIFVFFTGERQKEEKNPRMTNANTVPDQLSLASSPNHFRSGIRGHGQGGGGVAAKRRVGGIRRGGGGGGGRGGGGGGGFSTNGVQFL